MIGESLASLTLAHWEIMVAIVSGMLIYGYTIFRIVGTQVDEKIQGCNTMCNKNINTIESETKQIKENYLARFEEVKHEIRETKKDVLERIDMLVELLKLQNK